MSQQRSYRLEQEITKKVALNYLLYLPDNYEQSSQRWPLILFLHGMGERGDNIEVVNKHGLPKILGTKKDFPFIAISPQCPDHTFWPMHHDGLIALLDEIISTHAVDIDRIYVTGLSMGGYGTWELAMAYPQKFAAIAPICGGGTPAVAFLLKDVPTWAFHGAKDTVVPLNESERMVDALRACGGNVQLTVYPEADHDSWTETYNNPELYHWFLQHAR